MINHGSLLKEKKAFALTAISFFSIVIPMEWGNFNKKLSEFKEKNIIIL